MPDFKTWTNIITRKKWDRQARVGLAAAGKDCQDLVESPDERLLFPTAYITIVS